MTVASRGGWLRSPAFDGAWILAPPFVATGVALTVHASRLDGEVSPFAWLVLVVGVDVAHVYATLFRTYLDRDERRRRTPLYALAPLGAWLAGVIAYAVGAWLFWRLLAYLAVFHFVRQQYGFLRLYGQAETDTPRWVRSIDAAAIYAATLYPLIYWHTHLPRAFDWFVRGDFVRLPHAIDSMARYVYAAILLGYAAAEVARTVRSGRFNVPKNLVLAGTAISWWVGIVSFNGDLTFTLTNVVAHGVPYIGLVWLTVHTRVATSGAARRVWGGRAFVSLAGVPVFWGLLASLAYIEEGVWEGLIWRDHATLLPWFRALPQVEQPIVLALLVPLLALPQSTHYVLDGFIWKLSRPSVSTSAAS